MSRNPDGAPAGFYTQAGATAYLIDPAGAYSPAGASAPTTDPAGTDDGGTDDGVGVGAPTLAAAGVYIPIAGATSAAAEIVDPTASYRLAVASAPTTAAAGKDDGAGASAPTLAAADASIPITEATPAAEIVDPEGAYSLAGASAPTTDPAGRRSAAGAGAPTLAAPGTYTPATGATSAAEIGAYSLAGASAPTTDPAGGDRAAASAPTLAAPGASIPATGTTSAAAQILSLPGTYIPPGQTTPQRRPRRHAHRRQRHRADDRRGRHVQQSICVESSICNIYKHNPLHLHSVVSQRRPGGALLWRLESRSLPAKEFFATASSPNYTGTATMMFTRFGLGQRPHLLGANISNHHVSLSCKV